MKIEAGKHYKSRIGAIFGPFEWNGVFWIANGRTWANDGKYPGIGYGDFDLIEQVMVNVPFSTFPTWEEFVEWENAHIAGSKNTYNFFRDRIKTLVIGQEYEFRDDGEDWIRLEFRGYHAGQWAYEHIRPIQPDTEPDLLDSLRAWQKGDLPFDKMPEVLERAIKALEDSK